MDDATLDPVDWETLRLHAHRLLDQSLNHLQSAREGRVWTPMPQEMKDDLRRDVPESPGNTGEISDMLAALLPFGVGNTHPRFFGWVHGAGNPGGMLAEIAAAAMNANLGGRDHGAIHIERQVVDWCRQIMGFPQGASGLITSGTSMGTLIALKVARDRALGFDSRRSGVGGSELVGYASEQSHACIARAFDMLGLGSEALRLVPVDDGYRMNIRVLSDVIKEDIGAGKTPFIVVGTAGSVNVGAIDDLSALVKIAEREGIWLHVDGAFGAAGMLSETIRPQLAGIDEADSVAFDFHKWLHVNYAAGCVLVRDSDAHLRTFSDRPAYLATTETGLAAGAPWPVDYGPELSRGFNALKIWAHFLEHGTRKLGASISANCEHARYLGRLVSNHPDAELLAPVMLNIVCFRMHPPSGCDLDQFNQTIVTRLQESGIAAPSTTRLNGALAIRVNITNHRTRKEDLDTLMAACTEIAAALV